MNNSTGFGSIALIEPHDGEIESLFLKLDESSSVIFTRLAVYHEVALERYAVWIYRATLQIGGVYELRFRGDLREGFDDYVDDAVVSAGSIVINWKDLLVSKAASEIKIIFGSGRTLSIACRNAQLVLHDTIEHAEDWVGPLVSIPLPPLT